MVCSGIGLDLDAWSRDLFPDARETTEGLGCYVGLYTGWANDHDIRFHGASGGLVTGFLIHLLETGVITGAVVARFSPKEPTWAEAIVARSRESLIAARGSKYCPVSMDGVTRDIINNPGRVVIVGLPCHIHGFRKLAATNKALHDKVLGYFGLYCSSTRTSLLPHYLLKRYDIPREDVLSFAFRGEGNPGFLTIDRRNGDRIRIPYHDYYRAIRACFNLRRCTLCHDHTAELADVAFGDIHLPEFLGDPLGVNSVIVRNPVFHKLLHSAAADGALSIQVVAKEQICQSQACAIRMKKVRVHAAMVLRRLTFRHVPSWHLSTRQPAMQVTAFGGLLANRLQSEIGRRRLLWRLIRPIARLGAWLANRGRE
jgi:coenzyme F420 hydrogenase subunit beta